MCNVEESSVSLTNLHCSSLCQYTFTVEIYALPYFLVLEYLLQCNDFNRGHPRFFNQSEADSLTKNLDSVVLKANQIHS